MRTEVAVRRSRTGEYRCRSLSHPLPKNLQEIQFPPQPVHRFFAPEPLLTETEIIYWVEWLPITVKLWRKIAETGPDGRPPTPHEVEIRCWDVLAAKSNLFQTEQEKQHILRTFVPTLVLKTLLAPVLPTARLTREEEFLIKLQTHEMYSNPGSKFTEIHPLLVEASQVMSMGEKYGVTAYGSFDEMPQRLLSAFLVVAGAVGEAEAIEMQKLKHEENAKRAAMGMH